MSSRGGFQLSIIELLLVSVALATDACAVAISEGIRMTRLRRRNALKVGFFFGAFQAVMPVLGYVAGMTVDQYIESVDHWIAMGILCFIGIRMILEACRPSDGKESPPCASNTRMLCVLSLATSIDALAVGISLAIQHENIIRCAAVIGSVTFIICYFGVIVGKKLGHVFRKRAEILAGVVLILIGIKILLEHLLA